MEEKVPEVFLDFFFKLFWGYFVVILFLFLNLIPELKSLHLITPPQRLYPRIIPTSFTPLLQTVLIRWLRQKRLLHWLPDKRLLSNSPKILFIIVFRVILNNNFPRIDLNFLHIVQNFNISKFPSLRRFSLNFIVNLIFYCKCILLFLKIYI